jgi:hypothetical protein
MIEILEQEREISKDENNQLSEKEILVENKLNINNEELKEQKFDYLETNLLKNNTEEILNNFDKYYKSEINESEINKELNQELINEDLNKKKDLINEADIIPETETLKFENLRNIDFNPERIISHERLETSASQSLKSHDVEKFDDDELIKEALNSKNLVPKKLDKNLIQVEPQKEIETKISDEIKIDSKKTNLKIKHQKPNIQSIDTSKISQETKIENSKISINANNEKIHGNDDLKIINEYPKAKPEHVPNKEIESKTQRKIEELIINQDNEKLNAEINEKISQKLKDSYIKYDFLKNDSYNLEPEIKHSKILSKSNIPLIIMNGTEKVVIPDNQKATISLSPNTDRTTAELLTMEPAILELIDKKFFDKLTPKEKDTLRELNRLLAKQLIRIEDVRRWILKMKKKKR